MRVAVLGVCVLLAGCSADVEFNPEGFLCDPDNACPDGYLCVEGACRAACTGDGCNVTPINRCATVTCDAAPAATCVDATTRRSYLQAGTCEPTTGQCTYPVMETACEEECQDGACVGQAGVCAGVTCTTPPSPTCEGNNLRTWTGPGTCSASGNCSYFSSVASCPGGCGGGACVPVQLSFAETAPSVRALLTAVDVAPGSSGNHVLVAGLGGYVARWNGAAWTQLSSGTQSNLFAVSLYGGGGGAVGGAVVGAGGTVLLYDGNALTRATVPGLTASLLSVHATSATQVLVGGGAQLAVRSGTAWSLLSTNVGALGGVDAVRLEGGKAYAAGEGTHGSASGPAVARFGSLSSAGTVDVDTSPGIPFRALSPDLDPASNQYLYVSQETYVRRYNTQNGDIELSEEFSLPEGDEVVALSPAASASGTSALWALSGPSVGDSPGALFRVQRSGGAAPVVTRVAPVYGDAVALSRNDVGGVLLVDTLDGASNVSRHDGSTDAYLHFGEDWVAGAQGNAGRVLVSSLADVAWQSSGKWRLSRMETFFKANGAAGAGPVLLVGQQGGMLRWTPQGGHVVMDSGSTRNLNGVCRVSDTLWYAVGDVGTALLVSGPSVDALASVQQPVAGTTAHLRALACAPSGPNWAVGNGGTVLKQVGTNWQPVTPAPQTSVNLVAVVASGTTAWVGGDGFAAKYDGAAWTQLPGLAGLSGLALNADGVLFARAGNKVYRLNSSAWVQEFTASKPLRGGFVSGRYVMFVGDDGVVVDGR
ncbi:MAG: hypothetical protein FJ086_15060 [Deltaproteobacteria bacterium]|nr:hypothetical protein [Deltaproteobacteria bacterium]